VLITAVLVLGVVRGGSVSLGVGEDPEVGALLPCKVNVYRRQGRTYLSALLPSAMAAFYPGPVVEEVAREVERTVRTIVDRAR